MNVAQGVADLGEEFGQGLRIMGSEALVQAEPFDEVHGEVGEGFVNPHVEYVQEPRVPQAGHELGLSQEASASDLVLCDLSVEHYLERDLSAQFRVAGPEDDAHAAAAQHAGHGVGTEGSACEALFVVSIQFDPESSGFGDCSPRLLGFRLAMFWRVKRSRKGIQRKAWAYA